jgi:acetyltransferase
MADIIRLSATEAQRYLEELVLLLEDAVNNGASIGFLRPLKLNAARDYWRDTFNAVANGRVLLIARADNRVIGSVQLDLCGKENGSHRAEVQKLLVLTRYRRQGLAKQLMEAIELAARESQRSLLVLDTEAGSGAVPFYESLRWLRAGSIPDYAMSADGVPTPNVIYYKHT